VKAHARPPYLSCAGVLLLLARLVWGARQSAVAHGHVTATSAAFMMLGASAFIAVLVLMLRLRGFRIEDDRLIVTRLLSPRGIASHPLRDIQALARRKGVLGIALAGGVSYAVFDAYSGAPAMIRLLMSDELRGAGFAPARIVGSHP
jgi:hypothetical protein